MILMHEQSSEWWMGSNQVRQQPARSDQAGVGAVWHKTEQLMVGHSRRDDGFVLLSVLLVTTIIAAVAIGAAIVARAEVSATRIDDEAARARALSDAGLARAIAALEDGNDPLMPALLMSSAGIDWSYADQRVRLSLTREAGKVDLSAGDSDHIARVLQAVSGDEAIAGRMLARMADLRRNGLGIESVLSLLEPQERFGRMAQELDQVVTVLTAAKGIDAMAAPRIVLESLPGVTPDDLLLFDEARRENSPGKLTQHFARYGSLIRGERPLYRIRASAQVGDGVISRREAIVAQDVRTRRSSVVTWRDSLE
jgi:hypothetical protein